MNILRENWTYPTSNKIPTDIDKLKSGSMTTNLKESLISNNSYMKSVSGNPSPRKWLDEKREITVWRRLASWKDKVKGAILDLFPFISPRLDGVYPALLQWSLDALVTHQFGIFSASSIFCEGMETIQGYLYTKTRKVGLLHSKSLPAHMVCLEDAGEADREVHK